MSHSTSPLQTNERATILDALRGFALLGICMANAGYFSLYIFKDPLAMAAMSTATIDRWLGWFHFAFIDGKFYSLFSLLFGIGFSIIFLRNKNEGRNGLAVFYRRMFILLIFGISHSLLIWDGDILFFYAVVGMLLPLFRNSSNKTLLILAVVLLGSPLLFDMLKVVSNGKWNISKPFLQQALALDKEAGIDNKNVSTWLITHTSYSDLLAWLQSGTWWSWQLRMDSKRIPKVLAMFLLGLYVERNNIFRQLEQYKPLLKRVQVVGFALGVPAGIAHAFFEFDHKSLPSAMGLWDTASYSLNVVPLSLAYTSTFALWYNDRKMKKLFDVFKPAGRMALTNYIMQSIICVLLYHGIGFGLGSKVGPAVFIPLAVVIFIIQIMYSYIWFRYFNYGPLEWIWRMLTYGKYLPMIKQKI